MQPQEIQAHLQKIHGLLPGVVFDPYAHEEIPSLCFGTADVETGSFGGRPLLVGRPPALVDEPDWSKDPQ